MSDMSDIDNNVKIYVHPDHRPFRACFTIGVQTFYVCEREDRKEAEWYVNVLRTAFANYAFYLGGECGKALESKDKEIERLNKILRMANVLVLLDETQRENERLKLELKECYERK